MCSGDISPDLGNFTFPSPDHQTWTNFTSFGEKSPGVATLSRMRNTNAKLNPKPNQGGQWQYYVGVGPGASKTFGPPQSDDICRGVWGILCQ